MKMDPTGRFFTKLRKLAGTLETETARLQLAFENRRSDDSDENADRAMRAYHEMNCEVRELKVQFQDELAQQRAKEDEVSSFIKACRVMEQRVTDDIQRLRGHWQKYGYQPPQDSHVATKVKGDEGAEDGEEADPAGGDEGKQGEAGADFPLLSPPNVGPVPSTDLLRTPQLSDYGLSEFQLKRVLGGAELYSETPSMPEMSLPHPLLCMPMVPPTPVTPKCMLRMDEEDELHTPQMRDFGISEHTMCFNNDFTMDLHRKNIEKIERPKQNLPLPPENSGMESVQTRDSMESPEPPVFCTAGFKIPKSNARSSPPPPGGGDAHHASLPTTPELPAFQTQYMKTLLSTRKGARVLEPTETRTDDENQIPDLPSPCNQAASSKQTWEYDVPETSISGVEDMQIPEMPNLESVLGRSLQNRASGVTKNLTGCKMEGMEPSVPSMELDGPTQEFSLGTPRVRGHYQEPSTPEMPELSSVTQDICKLLSQTQPKKDSVKVVQPHSRPTGKENRALSLSVVSESEFHSLPTYLRQMTLSSLNQAIHNINSAITDKCHGEKAEFQMDELRKITGVGITAPIYFLCLTELKRLELVHGVGISSVYKVISRI
ncbi:SKA complex subunit 3 isoform X2 [Myripristis murdjan]|uniref:Spindle and kinetochore associated complex subunit 3 n=1 Tax=Myripristis murdjan TaxID=586833 RepID=A0A667ZBJ2_9TELE|nr:spindle and kinetochore-associated protein 3 isoform X2 [Myripristis murdjan]